MRRIAFLTRRAHKDDISRPAATPRRAMVFRGTLLAGATILASAAAFAGMREVGIREDLTPEDFARLIRAESNKWAPVIKRTGAKID